MPENRHETARNLLNFCPMVSIPGVAWKHIEQPDSPELDELALEYTLHELDIEDCRHGRQVAKVVEHATYTFVVVKTIEYNHGDDEIQFHDFDLFLLPENLISVAEGRTSVVERTVDRLPAEPEFHHPRGLAYLLIDYTVDQYLPVLDEIGDMIADLEDQVIEKPTPAALERIFRLKRMLIEFRRNVTAMREVVNHLMRTARPEQAGGLYPYYRDVYDHLVRALDFVESYRDLLSGTLDIYLSSIANRTNDVMKLLTIWGTISIPMVVVTGFFGMNVHLPLQESPQAVYVVVGAMGLASVLLLFAFRRKGWL